MALGLGSSSQQGIGRAPELATLAFARDAAHGGRGSFLVVAGEAGIGKTWLLEASAAAAEEEGFRVGWGSCWPLRDAPPLWPWRQAVTELCGEPIAALADSSVEDADWFERDAAVVDELRGTTADQPGMLVLDDAHAADAPTLHLARFLARHVRTLRLVVVVAHRPRESLAGGLDQDGTLLALRGLGRDEVAAVLAGQGVDPLPDADLDFIVQATGGYPLEVQRMAMAGAEPVRALIADRLAALSADERALAARAAVLDAAPRLAEVAALGDVSDSDASRAVLALERERLVRRDGPDRVVFASESVRAALTKELPPSELLDVHARAVGLLSPAAPGSRDRVLRRARHALAAGGRSTEDARRAVALAQEAAAILGAESDHTAAADLLAAARELHEQAGLGPAPAALQAAHGNAVLLTGHLAAARELFDQAARAAEAEGDRISAAVAAAGYGGVWLSEMRSPLDREHVLGLQRRALAHLPDGEVVLHHRLTARLAAEGAYAAGRPELMEPALEAARALDDPAVLAEVLSLYHHTMLGPEHGATRLPVARELLSVATTAGDALLSLMGLCWLTVDLFLAGQPHAVRSLGALRERADATGCRSIGYIAEVLDVMLLIRDGRLDEAESRAAQAYEMGIEVGDADALAYYGAQLVIMRWLQGRSGEVLGLVAETAASPTLAAANHAFVAVNAALAADCGELDQARAALTRLRAAAAAAPAAPTAPDDDGTVALPSGGVHDLDRIPSSSASLATLFSVIEAASVLGDAATAQRAARLLEPFGDLPVMASLGVVCLGSVRRSLGLAALTAGDTQAAVTHLDAAVLADERLGNRPMAALTRADLARALVARGRPGDRSAAVDQLDHAIREGTAVGLGARVVGWRRRRQALDEPAASVRTGDLAAAVGVIRRQGAGWILTAGEHEVVTPDLLGMAYLARLLTRPGVEIGATELAAGVTEAEVVRPDQPVLDDRALAQYRQRVSELEDEVAEAERFADTERAARARVELDALVDELSRSTNVFGRSRSFSSSAERARTAVRKAVRRALDQIEAADPVLGAALGRSVRTGRTCCYEPGPGAPRRWIERPG